MGEPISLIAGGLLAGGALAGAAVITVRRRRQARASSWHAAVRRLRLGDTVETPRRWPRGPRLTVRSDELGVRLEGYRRGRSESGTRVVIDGLGPGAEALTLRHAGIGMRLFGPEDLATGDPKFDRAVHVEGPALLVLALLTAPVRGRLARLLGGQVDVRGQSPIEVSAKLEGGRLEVRFPEPGVDTSGEQLALVLRTALAAARRLVPPGDLPGRLTQNLRQEPVAGVRVQILLTLARELPDHPETRKALLAGLRDRNDEVRLRAAIALGPEGHKTLHTLISSFRADDGCAARALEALADHLPSGRVKTVLEGALAAGRKQTALACLDLLGRRRYAGAQGLYRRALDDGDSQVAVAAARALGQAGTVAAVALLRPRASSLLPGPLRSAARQAIAEIQSRLPGAGPGQLTLAVGEAGALSLSEEAGGLSLAGEQPGEAEPTAGETDLPAGPARVEEG